MWIQSEINNKTLPMSLDLGSKLGEKKRLANWFTTLIPHRHIDFWGGWNDVETMLIQPLFTQGECLGVTQSHFEVTPLHFLHLCNAVKKIVQIWQSLLPRSFPILYLPFPILCSSIYWLPETVCNLFSSDENYVLIFCKQNTSHWILHLLMTIVFTVL